LFSVWYGQSACLSAAFSTYISLTVLEGFRLSVSSCFALDWKGCTEKLTLRATVAGGFGSAVLLAVEAALQAEYLDGHNLSGTKGAVAIYFIIAWFYTCTLECTGYVYGCEIWPTHLRSKGAAISYFGFYICSIWATAPAAQAFKAIGWKYYMVFIAVTVVLTIPCMFYLPEVSSF
jgi:hypothetical protein